MDLTAIALLKNVLAVKDIKLLLGAQIHEGEAQEFYARFLAKVDESFGDVAGVIDPAFGPEQLAELAMDLAVAACAAKIACVQLLGVLRGPDEPAPEGKNKNRERARERR